MANTVYFDFEIVLKRIMKRIKLVLEYDGTHYFGWQLQKGQHSVQQELEQALAILVKQPIRVIAAGRTDTGVHARNQVVHCDVPEVDLRKLVHGLNGIMQKDVVVKSARWVAADFHARFDATARRYHYFISTERSALNRNYAWIFTQPLNKTLMQAGAEIITDYENFKSFCKVKSNVKHYKCTIFTSRFFMLNGLLVYEIKANRFLHGMVRAIVGSLLELGRGKISLNEFRAMIEAQDRRKVPATAPARGLVLEEITY